MSDAPAKVRYTVMAPIAGSILIDVNGPEGLTEKEAIDLAFEKGEIDSVNALWEVFPRLTQGNVRYISVNESQLVEAIPLGKLDASR